MIDGVRPKRWGRGVNVRDRIHVGDRHTAVWAILDRGRACAPTHLVDADGKMDGREVVEPILEQTRLPTVACDLVADRPCHDMPCAFDSSTLRTRPAGEPHCRSFSGDLSHSRIAPRRRRAWPQCEVNTEATYAQLGQ